MNGTVEKLFLFKILEPSFLAGLSCGICLTWFISKSLRVKSSSEISVDKPEDLSDGDGEIKLILVVRTDLKMGKGKAAAQCAHAAVSAYQKAKARKPNILREWEECGQPKIVVKCDSQEELLGLSRKAQEFNLITSVIKDAGRTQIPSGSFTVLGVGPGPADAIDEVTGHLKLY